MKLQRKIIQQRCFAFAIGICNESVIFSLPLLGKSQLFAQARALIGPCSLEASRWASLWLCCLPWLINVAQWNSYFFFRAWQMAFRVPFFYPQFRKKKVFQSPLHFFSLWTQQPSKSTATTVPGLNTLICH